MSQINASSFFAKGLETGEGQSLRFEDGDVAYLSKTFASAGDRKTYTISLWTKLGNRGTWKYLFAGGTSSNGGQRGYLVIDGSDQIYFQIGDSSVNTSRYYISNAVYRDPSAWYHIVLAVDTTRANSYNSTAGTNRVELYVNGDFVSFGSATNAVGLNYANSVLNNNTTHYVGADEFGKSSSTNVWDGYIANVAFIDGQALDPTYFGEYEGTLWKPKSNSDVVNLNFGTNGFYLPFKQTTQAEGFSTVTYTGNGGTQGIEGVGFEPDFVWIKNRSSALDHRLFDSVRGVNETLFSNTTSAEYTDTDQLMSFDSEGFTVGADTGVNQSSSNHVAWCWDAGSGSAASNTDGSITTTVKANTAKGFSIVKYQGGGSVGDTIGHGLNGTPDVMIIKNRDSAQNWVVYHSGLSATNKGLSLNTTGTEANLFQTNQMTATTMGLDSSSTMNGSGVNYIAYFWEAITGYSSFGSYSGTGSTGNKITTGFKPAFVMVKGYDQTRNWIIWDNTRTPTNPADGHLHPSASVAEQTGSDEIQFDSDGFTFLSGDADSNTSGFNYIYMAFADTRDATFFGDTSGNSNNWTPNALNNTDVLPDSPVTGGNFASWNPISQQTSSTTFSEGNLKALIPASTANGKAMPTMGVNSGKWYWEYYYSVSNGNYLYVGITDPSAYTNNSYWIRGSDGETFKYENGTNSTGSGTTHRHTQGDIIQVAFDADNGKWYVGKNGTWSFSGDPVAGTGYVHNNIVSGEYGAFAANATSSSTQTVILNTGADSSFAGNATPQGNTDSNGVGDFYYAPPSGFLALTTSNLPAATITAPDEYFNTVLWTGDGTTGRSITSVNFQPDWIWYKDRTNGSYAHVLTDAVRGNTNFLMSDSTSAELTSTETIQSFDSDGFTIGNSAGVNTSGDAYVAWNWLAGNSTVSNTDGSITSTVSANQTAGFSIATFTSASGTNSVGHGLGVKPKLVIQKRRNSTSSWYAYYDFVDGSLDYLTLDTTAASAAWGGTAATSSVFYENWSAGGNIVAYSFAEIEGYSKIGSYTGNGSSNGTFVHCGFRPAWVMFKRTDTTGNWWMIDSKRDITNQMSNILLADSSSAEFNTGTGWPGIDYVSNGFKLRGSAGGINASGGSYIFLAFAEAPFKLANAR